MLNLRSNPQFITFAVGIAIFTDLFLYGIIVPVLPYALESRFHVSQADIQSRISTLLAIYAAGTLGASPIVGLLADRSNGRRLPLLAGLLALLGSTLLFALGRTFDILIAARLLQGISAAVVWTVGLALIVDTVPAAKLGRAMSIITIFLGLGICFGPILGGILYDRVGYYGPFYLAFALLTLDIVLRLAIIEKHEAKIYRCVELAGADPESSLSNRVVKNEDATPVVPQKRFHTPLIIRLLASSRLLAGLWMGFIFAVIATAFDAVLPLYLLELWDFSALSSGLLYGALVLPSLFLASVTGYWIDTRGTKSVAILGILLIIPFLILLRLPNATDPRSGQIALMAVLLALTGTAMTLFPTLVEVAQAVEEREKLAPGTFGRGGGFAQAYALFNIAFSSGTLVGPLIGGKIKEEKSWGRMLICLAAVAASSLIPTAIWTGGPWRDAYWIRRRPRDKSPSSPRS